MEFLRLTLLFALLNQTLPRLLDAPGQENMHAKILSCGARHSALITGMPLWTSVGIIPFASAD